MCSRGSKRGAAMRSKARDSKKRRSREPMDEDNASIASPSAAFEGLHGKLCYMGMLHHVALTSTFSVRKSPSLTWINITNQRLMQKLHEFP